jgi:hypothetical protein
MRNSVIIVLSGIILLVEALVAHADNAGPVTPQAAGTANPVPPAASDIGQQEPPKPVLNGNSAMKTNGIPTDGRAVGPFTGADTSTAGPGGQAESSANGALSSPPDQATAQQADQRKTSAEHRGDASPHKDVK